MSIYDFNLKGMRKAFKDFRKTAYGKLIFLVSYIAPLILFVVGTSVTLYGVINVSTNITTYGLIILGAFVLFFIAANAFYYAEVRHFCDRNKVAKATTKTTKKVAKKSAKKSKK
ncbi:MAG: hypothetical protein K6G36_02635 [Candidatus Saccharibacteria bacterium]|nr:hypothetical protein [Candidatus Saccharibacteria bacterium]